MSPLGLCVLVFTVVLICVWIYKWRHPSCSSGVLPPGCMGLPIIGETIQFLLPSKSIDIPRFTKTRIERYGPIFKTSLAGRPVVVSSDPEFNHFIFQQEGKMVELWYLDSFAALLGQKGSTTDGSTTKMGHVHKYLRSLVLSHFGHEALKERLITKLEKMAVEGLHACSKQEIVEIKQASSMMIFNTTAKEMFGYDPRDCKENLGESFTNFLQGLMSFPLNIPGTAFHKCLQTQKKAVKVIKAAIEKRRMSFDENQTKDLLSCALQDMEKENFLTDDFIAVVVFGLLLASFETIAATITLGVKLIAENGLALQEMKEENEAVLRKREGGGEEGLTWEEYKSLKFTHQVVNELLRMASVAPGILRRVVKDVHYNGYTIPTGWTIMAVPSAVQLNPEIYPGPLEFNPWRWKNRESTLTAKNFIPFGGGSRACAGADFSKALMTVFFHVLVTKYTWTNVGVGEVHRSPSLAFGKGSFIKLEKREAVPSQRI